MKIVHPLPFLIGWHLGNDCDREFSFAESCRFFPHWNDQEHDAFCQGSVDGHAHDPFRFEKAKQTLSI